MVKREWFELVMIALLVLGVAWLTSQLNQLKQTAPPVNQLTTVSASPGSKPTTLDLTTGWEKSLSALQTSLEGLSTRVNSLEENQDNQVPTTVSQTSSNFQAQTIYLGSTSVNQRDWTETGLEATLNSADFPANVQATFEAGLNIIGGEAWARLKNKTTGAILSITEVMHNNSTTTWKSSPAFKLHPGSNRYMVELKSSSGETANLTGARIKLSL